MLNLGRFSLQGPPTDTPSQAHIRLLVRAGSRPACSIPCAPMPTRIVFADGAEVLVESDPQGVSDHLQSQESFTKLAKRPALQGEDPPGHVWVAAQRVAYLEDADPAPSREDYLAEGV